MASGTGAFNHPGADSDTSYPSFEMPLGTSAGGSEHPLSRAKSQLIDLLPAQYTGHRTNNGESPGSNNAGSTGADRGSGKCKKSSNKQRQVKKKAKPA